ncbi:MAG: RHS repeat-associated core domain-containing protein [Ignavibacteriales bacterium]|nr:RHS repeat-associated core domain-containing protein [Ignavibacteriales bacterium]
MGIWYGVDPLADKYPGLSPYNYCLNNPVNSVDPDGMAVEKPLDTILDIAFITFDVGKLAYDKVTTGKTNREDWAALGADVVCALTPVATGGGMAVRGASKADDAVDAVRAADKVGEITYQTYTKTNKETGKTYYGKTSGSGTPDRNIENRDKRHHMNGKGYGKATLDKSSKNKDAIRGREQQNIDKGGGSISDGGSSGNTNRSVSKKNKNAKKYEDAAKKEFGD